MNRRRLAMGFATRAAAVMALALPSPLAACGGCVDGNLDLRLPFVKWWFLAMLGWALLRGIAEGGFVRRALTGVCVYFAIAMFTLGSSLMPALLFSVVWVGEVLYRQRRRDGKEGVGWWVAFNRLTMVFLAASLVYGQTVTVNDPARLINYARRHYGGASFFARTRLVALGRRALPVIVDQMVAPEAGRSEEERVRGVVLAQQATGLDFEDSPEKLLAWWAGEKNRPEPERWMPAPSS